MYATKKNIKIEKNLLTNGKIKSERPKDKIMSNDEKTA